jgi:hypothetical protein
MTDRRSRLPRAWVRAIAWVVGGTTFFSIAGALGAAPKPASSAPSKVSAAPRRVVIRKIVRRVIIVDAPRAPVAASAPTSVSSSNSGGSSAPAPAPPTTSTGGS